MNAEKRKRMYQLCALIEEEKDHQRFIELIQELNELLERKQDRLEENR
jgi:hypothetical protein